MKMPYRLETIFILMFLIIIFGIASLGVWRSQQTAHQPVDSDAIYHSSYWDERIRSKGAKQAYMELKSVFENESYGMQHSAAHIFGELLYEHEGVKGLNVCDKAFTYGCYHSFFAASMKQQGMEVVPKLIAACEDALGAKRSACLHGIGHGAVGFAGYDNLEEALRICEQKGANFEMGCSIGVFMEHNFRTMEASGSAEKVTRQFGKDQPYEPCRSLPTRFRHDCYFGQVDWWDAVYSGNYQKIVSLCEGLTDTTERNGCFGGVGNNVAEAKKYDSAKINEVCDSASRKEDAKLCRYSAAWIILFDIKNQQLALEICKGLDPSFTAECTSNLQGNAFWK